MAAGMDRFVATMVFCEAPFDGTMGPAVPAAGKEADDRSTATEVVSALLEATKEYFNSGVTSPPPAQRGEDSLAVFFEVAALE